MTTSAVVPAGWQIRLSLAGADFPVVWPPGEKVTLTFDPTRSRLLLPAVPPRGEAGRIAIPAAPSPPSPPGLEGDDDAGTTVTRTGSLLTYERKRSSREHQPARADLTYSSDETWAISVEDDDPASTRVRSDAEVRMERPGWAVTTKGTLELSSDADNFYLSIGLTALQEGEVVFSRTWTDAIAREWA
jgi:hypothetical protein